MGGDGDPLVDSAATRRSPALPPSTPSPLPLLLAATLAAAAAAASGAAADTVLVPKGAGWRYHADGAAPAGAWSAPGYDHGAWRLGPAPLGFGEVYIATAVPYGPNPAQKHVTSYFRHAFPLEAPPATGTLRLRVRYDDGFALSLNGVEVARRSLPAGPLAYGTLATAHEATLHETLDLTPQLGLLVPGTNVLAAEVHQSSASSSDLVWEAELTAVSDTTLTRGPYLQRGTADGVTIRWRTNVPTASEVRVGSAPGALERIVTEPTLTTEHEVEVDGLGPGARAWYSVGSPDRPIVGGDARHAFTTDTAPGEADSVRLWFVGDCGRGSAGQAAVRDGFEAWLRHRPLDGWVLLGDNAYETGTDAEFQAKFFPFYPDAMRSTVLWPTRGNPDVVRAGPANDYYDFFTMPTAGESGGVPSGTEAYYSFDRGNVHVVVLDSEGSDRTTGGPMVRWLREDLAATDADWVVACWHHPPYTKGTHDSDNELDSGGRMGDMRRVVVPVLDSLGADLTITGHSHGYERSMLIRGHTGTSATFDASMILDAGDGRLGGDGSYVKPSAGQGPLEGMVHVVAGSAALAGGGPLNHPAMRASLNRLGSLVLDARGLRLDGRFVADDGAVLDSFTIVKGSPLAAPRPFPARIRLALEGPNPAAVSHAFRYTLPERAPVRLAIHDAAGRRVAALAAGVREAGTHRVAWSAGAAPAGVYLAVLEQGGFRSVVRFVHLR